MSIDLKLLYSIGAREERFHSGQYIFFEDDAPRFYYHIVEGYVKLNNYNGDGKELIQNIFSGGSCFGESMLILEKPYPVNAIALTECTVLKLSKEKFKELMGRHPQIPIEFCTTLSEKTYNKFVHMRKMSSRSAIERLTEMMDLMKESQDNKDKYSFKIDYTRQQLASLTGLCVETTIRAVKKMEECKLLKIRNRKIYY
ncbi:Crp/Fnr family transcriptional regulator [uncultured Chryseobacterium sp.]|uniref:Crp/Fnr family transcriptional regulator n=1 Tax=uncultured Chryseobacterium sp. TaxID=259322 RepID=UPI0025DF3810|nr:Crp/Fnr family transcriptional regulator [uncultured Chryseobacterium sp.]